MGTTLTGTTPQDTYDSLIKVTDNGPLSGSLKVLTDGLGNNSTLSLSTAAASIAGTLAVTGAATLSSSITASGIASLGIGQTTELAYIGDRTTVNTRYIKFERASALTDIVNIQGINGGVGATDIALQAGGGNVGIGTNAPALALELNSSTTAALPATTGGTQSTGGRMRLTTTGASTAVIDFGTAGGSGGWIQATNKSDLTTQYALLLNPNGGSVGIGTSAPAVKLDVVGDIRSSTGILFGTDTAAANLLDDYEEGTFTAVLNPLTSGTITLNATYNTWSYTKIGRQVTIKGLALVSSVASPVGTEVYLSGLPFAILNSNSARGTASVTYFDQSASTWSSVPNKHGIAGTFLDFIVDASTVAANDEFYITLTYFTA